MGECGSEQNTTLKTMIRSHLAAKTKAGIRWMATLENVHAKPSWGDHGINGELEAPHRLRMPFGLHVTLYPKKSQ